MIGQEKMNKWEERESNDIINRWHDQEYDGTYHEQLGIAIWKATSDKETQSLHKIEKIK